MKKLLSLLSVLTISGTAVPTTIAASKYEREETINKNNTNYQQTNRLENLTRNKRYIVLNISLLIPSQVNITLPHGFLQRNNPPSNFMVKNTIWAASRLPRSFPYIWAFRLQNLTRHGVTVLVDHFTHEGIVYNGSKYVTFYDV